jgi:hypothetical protein
MATKLFAAATKERDKSMKTNRITLTLAVVAIAAAFSINLKAAEPLLSPRAQDNRIRTVPGVTGGKLYGINQFKHRGDLPFHPIVEGATSNRDLVRERQNITVSPRVAEPFPRLFAGASRSATTLAAKADCTCKN